MNARARVRAEDGQIIPPLLVILLLCLVFGFMMLQVGLAADYKSRSQTAADAAALAGAIEVKREILAAYAMDHQLQPEEIQMGLVCAQAAMYAASWFIIAQAPCFGFAIAIAVCAWRPRRKKSSNRETRLRSSDSRRAENIARPSRMLFSANCHRRANRCHTC